MFQPVLYTAHAQLSQFSQNQIQWHNPNLMDGVDTLAQTLTHQPSLPSQLIQLVITPNYGFFHHHQKINLTIHLNNALKMLLLQLQNQELEKLQKLLKWCSNSSKVEALNFWEISKLSTNVLVSANPHSSMLPNQFPKDQLQNALNHWLQVLLPWLDLLVLLQVSVSLSTSADSAVHSPSAPRWKEMRTSEAFIRNFT